MAPLYNLEMYLKAIRNDLGYEIVLQSFGFFDRDFDRDFWIYHFLIVLLFLLACGFLLGRYHR